MDEAGSGSCVNAVCGVAPANLAVLGASFTFTGAMFFFFIGVCAAG